MAGQIKEDLKNAFETLLDIPNVEIEKVEIDKGGNYIVTIKSTEKGTRCHKCGRAIHNPYGHDPLITLRHLPIFGKQVYM